MKSEDVVCFDQMGGNKKVRENITKWLSSRELHKKK